MKNFLYTKLLSMGILLMAAFTLVGYMDEDERIGYDISGLKRHKAQRLSFSPLDGIATGEQEQRWTTTACTP